MPAVRAATAAEKAGLSSDDPHDVDSEEPGESPAFLVVRPPPIQRKSTHRIDLSTDLSKEEGVGCLMLRYVKASRPISSYKFGLFQEHRRF